MISKNHRMSIRETFTDTKPTLSIGKNGVTPNLVQETLRQLNISEIIKIRVLKSALQHETFDAIKNNLIERIHIDLVETRGHTILLYKAKQEA
jgi:RNA-binding protein YhbY